MTLFESVFTNAKGFKVSPETEAYIQRALREGGLLISGMTNTGKSTFASILAEMTGTGQVGEIVDHETAERFLERLATRNVRLGEIYARECGGGLARMRSITCASSSAERDCVEALREVHLARGRGTEGGLAITVTHH